MPVRIERERVSCGAEFRLEQLYRRDAVTHPSLLNTTNTLPSSLPHLSPSTTFNPTTAPSPPRRTLILASKLSKLSSTVSLAALSPSSPRSNPQPSSSFKWLKSSLEAPTPTELSVSQSPIPVVILSFAWECPLPLLAALGEGLERTTEGSGGLFSPEEEEGAPRSQEVREAIEREGDMGLETAAEEGRSATAKEVPEEGGSRSKVGDEMPIVALAFLALPALWEGVSAPEPLGVVCPSPKALAPEMERRVATEAAEPR